MKHAPKDMHGNDLYVHGNVPYFSLELEAWVMVHLELEA
jgi:hypothetical protein